VALRSASLSATQAAESLLAHRLVRCVLARVLITMVPCSLVLSVLVDTAVLIFQPKSLVRRVDIARVGRYLVHLVLLGLRAFLDNQSVSFAVRVLSQTRVTHPVLLAMVRCRVRKSRTFYVRRSHVHRATLRPQLAQWPRMVIASLLCRRAAPLLRRVIVRLFARVGAHTTFTTVTVTAISLLALSLA
jgi:hypothetical protein